MHSGREQLDTFESLARPLINIANSRQSVGGSVLTRSAKAARANAKHARASDHSGTHPRTKKPKASTSKKQKASKNSKAKNAPKSSKTSEGKKQPGKGKSKSPKSSKSSSKGKGNCKTNAHKPKKGGGGGGGNKGNKKGQAMKRDIELRKHDILYKRRDGKGAVISYRKAVQRIGAKKIYKLLVDCLNK